MELNNVMDPVKWPTMFLDLVTSAKAKRIIYDFIDFNVQAYCLEGFQLKNKV
jgi:hypothetical protein